MSKKRKPARMKAAKVIPPNSIFSGFVPINSKPLTRAEFIELFARVQDDYNRINRANA